MVVSKRQHKRILAKSLFNRLTMDNEKINIEGSIKSRVFQTIHDVVEVAKPLPTISSWFKDGKLTPAEFEAAGDKLIASINGWSWQKAGNTVKKILPNSDKQYLLMKDIVCIERPAQFTADALLDPVEDVAGDDWVIPPKQKHRPDSDSMSIDTEKSDNGTSNWMTEAQEDYDDDDDLNDDEADEDYDEDFEIDLSLNKPSDLVTETAKASAPNQDSHRLYHISIVYDNFYNVPRVYLLGFSRNHTSILPIDEMMQDVSPGFLGKTVTMKAHPHTGIDQISIHPCRHADMFLELIKTRPETKPLTPDRSILILLKFINTAVPTIPYPLPNSEVL